MRRGQGMAGWQSYRHPASSLCLDMNANFVALVLVFLFFCFAPLHMIVGSVLSTSCISVRV